jgi:D-3-phosphoglycerate dehydrogenase
MKSVSFGVLVVNQSGANAQAVAEHVVAMLLSLAKNILQTDRSLRKERGMNREAFKGRNSHGRTIGIVGIGNVGKRVAHICRQGLGMQVLAYDPYLTSEQIESRGAVPADLETLLAQSDYVTVHCPYNDETRGLISHREIALGMRIK